MAMTKKYGRIENWENPILARCISHKEKIENSLILKQVNIFERRYLNLHLNMLHFILEIT